MSNPVLNMIQGKNNLSMALKMIKGKDPNELYNQMLQNNPQFREFVEKNKDKTVEQIAYEYNINPSILNIK